MDPDRLHYPFRRVCYVTMNQEAARAAYEALHEKRPYHDGTFTSWAERRGPSHPFHYNAGVSIGVADEDLTPWDEFTTKADASPVPSEAQEPEGGTPEGEPA